MRSLSAATLLLMLAFAGCKLPDINIDPFIPTTTTTTTTTTIMAPTTTLAPTGCGCDLSRPRDPLLPQYSDATVAPTECTSEVESGKHIRVCVFRGPGSQAWWIIGTLWRPGYTFNADDTYTCHCFDADGGRYHFVGYSGGEEHPENIVPWSPEKPFPAGEFEWWEFRTAKP